jgi:hypothetical protein
MANSRIKRAWIFGKGGGKAVMERLKSNPKS